MAKPLPEPVEALPPGFTAEEKIALSKNFKRVANDITKLATRLPTSDPKAASDAASTSDNILTEVAYVSDAARSEKTTGDGNAESTADSAAPTPPATRAPAKIGWKQQPAASATNATDDPSLPPPSLEWPPEGYYGEHWHNAAVIFFAVIATWICTGMLGGGLTTCVVILAICGAATTGYIMAKPHISFLFVQVQRKPHTLSHTLGRKSRTSTLRSACYYNRSIKRTRRNMRDDVERHCAMTRLETDEETVDWMNAFLSRFWVIYEPVLSSTIVYTVDSVLAASTSSIPGLDSISLTTFTLGTKCPIIAGIRTYPRTEQDVVLMDWDLSFTPNDLEDLTVREAKNKINPKIVLTVRVGKGLISGGIPIIVEDISFAGKVRIQIKLMNNFPHAKTLGISFLTRPEIDYKLKPLGGETLGFDIAHFPGLQDFIRDQIHGILGPMMYAPAVFELDIESMMSGAGYAVESAAGILQITVHSARGLPKTDLVGSCDPYVNFHVHNRAVLGKTEVKENTLNPVWTETLFILLKDLSEPITAEVFDWNNLTKDQSLCLTNLNLLELLKHNKLEKQWFPLHAPNKDKERGEIQLDALWHPVAPSTLEDGTPAPPLLADTGILRVNIHQCKNLDARKSLQGKWSPYIDLSLNNKVVFTTRHLKRTNNPVWEETVEIFVPDITSAVLRAQVRDDRGLAADPYVGHWEQDLVSTLSEWHEKKMDWRNLRDNATGRLKITFNWRPIKMDSSVAHKGAKPPPLGVLRFCFFEGSELRNVEALTGGKSDPFVRVSNQGDVLCQTAYVDNNLNPKWNELHYIIIRSEWDVFALDVLDHNEITKHKKLGTTNIDVQRLMGTTVDGVIGAVNPGTPFETTVQLIQDEEGRKTKGTLHYDATFFPVRADELDETPPVSDADRVTSTPPLPLAPERTAELKPSASAMSLDTSKMTKDLIQAETRARAEAAARWSKVRRKRLTHNNGILRVFVRQAKLSRRVNGSVEVFVTGQKMPVLVTDVQKKVQDPVWDHVGETFVRDLSKAKVVLRVFDRQDANIVVGHWAGSVLERLQKQFAESPEEWIKLDEHNSIRINFDWTPTDVTMHASEYEDNTGTLHVDVLDAQNLPAADSGGTSDPYVNFDLDEARVHKTKTHKKTLSPVFNESFTCRVTNKYRAALKIEVKDFNKITSSVLLGTIDIPLAPFEDESTVERAFPLQSAPSGTLRLRITFKLDPEVKARLQQSRASFTTMAAVAKAASIMTANANRSRENLREGLTGSGADLRGQSLAAAGAAASGGKSRSRENLSGSAADVRDQSLAATAARNRSGETFIGSGSDLREKTLAGAGGRTRSGENLSASGMDLRDPSVAAATGAAATAAAGADRWQPTTAVSAAPRDGTIPEDGVPPILAPLELSNREMQHAVSLDSIASAQSLEAKSSAGSVYSGYGGASVYGGDGNDAVGVPGSLTVTIIEAKDLRAADSNGLSDPYIKVRLGRKQVHKTKVIKKSLNPKWNDRFTIADVPPHHGILSFHVKDYNMLGENVDLGIYDVRLWDVIRPSDPEPKLSDQHWSPALKGGDEGKLHILLEFTPAAPADGTSPPVRRGSKGFGASLKDTFLRH